MLMLLLYIFIIIVLVLAFLVYIVFQLTNGRCKSNTCLIGKTAIITGGNSGMGFRVALTLAGRGCRIIIADVADGEIAKQKIIDATGNPNITYKYINLSSFETVRKFAQEINETETRLDILINHAGGGLFSMKKTEDDCSLGMQVNHFGGFLLTHLLVDLLKKSAPSRIIFTSSGLAFFNNLTIDNLNDPPLYAIYSNSKVCNIIAADGFAKRLKGTGVTSNSVHPGLVNTAIFSKVNNHQTINNTHNILSNLFYRTILPLYGKSAEEGAQTILHVALSKKLEKVTGKFFADCAPFFLRPPVTNDEEVCSKIWKLSEKYAKLKPEEKL